jgi:GNAT superfamily N-acetyltransferase
MTLRIRKAEPSDAAGAVDVLRRSIRELCGKDHRDDPAEIDAWLANKTAETWAQWVAHPEADLLVADRAGLVCGVGMVRSRGEILLNYVSPEARFQGISTAMLAALEAQAVARGAEATHLESTRTAERFYLARGYDRQTEGEPLRLGKRLVP